MYGYIYKTTNILNKKLYIGQHRAEKFDTSYFGSGAIICNAIKKYGKSAFVCEIIETCESDDELNDREAYWIAYYNSTNESIGYNIRYGGKQQPCPEYVKRKISEKAIGRYSEDTYIHKGDIEKHISKKLLDSFIKDGWVIGRSEKTKSNLSAGYNYSSKGMLGKPQSDYQKMRASAANKYKRSEEVCDNMRKAHAGKVLVYKEDISFYINKDELDKYIADGYKRGRNPKISGT